MEDLQCVMSFWLYEVTLRIIPEFSRKIDMYYDLSMYEEIYYKELAHIIMET